jgi:hypothetical protein
MATMTVDQLVPKIETALNAVRAKSKGLGITLIKAEVELSVTGKLGGEGGLKFDFIVEVDVSGGQERSRGQILSLTLTPKGGPLTLGEAESDDLAEGIMSLAAAINRARASTFEVTEGTVVVEFGVTTEGKLKVVVGGGKRETKGAHKLKLTFRPG